MGDKIDVVTYFDGARAVPLPGVSKNAALDVVRTLEPLATYLKTKKNVHFCLPNGDHVDVGAEKYNKLSDVLGADNRVDIKTQAPRNDVNNNNNQGQQHTASSLGDMDFTAYATSFATSRPRALSFGDSGITLQGAQPISKRAQTLQYLMDRMFNSSPRKNVVLIRAPPGSGKTSLATLLEVEWKAKGCNVIFVDLLRCNTAAEFNQLTESIDTVQSSASHPYVLILDEAQSAYAKPDALPLWRRLKAKSSSATDTPHVFVIALAAYGNNVPGGILTEGDWRGMVAKFHERMGYKVLTDDAVTYLYQDCHTHMGLLDAVCVMLERYCAQAVGVIFDSATLRSLADYDKCKREIHGLAFTPFGFPCALGSYLLHATPAEIEEYIADVNRRMAEQGLQMHISRQVASCMHGLIGGHLGFWSAAIRALYDKFKANATQTTISDGMLLQYLRSKGFIDSVMTFRARPNVQTLTDIEKGWVINVMCLPPSELRVPVDHINRAAVYSLMQKGILFYADAPLEQDFKILAERVEFITPLIAMICFVELFGSQSVTTVRRNDARIVDFLPQVVRSMDNGVLRNTFGRGIDHQLLERVWQMEFYRSAMSLLPPSQFVSPEVGGLWGLASRCDFYINSHLQWLFELLRDGIDLSGHLQRFGSGDPGDYLRIPHKDYAVVDFYVGQTPVCTNFQDEHYWCVVFADGFASASIYHGGHKTDVTLVGHADAVVAAHLVNVFTPRMQ